MMNLKVAFSRAVRQLRQERGISQERFAHVAHISRVYYSAIEGGKKNVSLELIERITVGLGIDTGELFALAEQIRKDNSASSSKRKEPH